MSKVNVAGNAIVVTSSLKYEDIALVEKYKPKALKLADEDGNQYFAIGTSTNGSISKNGIEFDGETRDDDKLATVTLFISASADNEDIKEMIADCFGEALSNLNILEESLPSIVKEITEQKEKIMAGITIQ